MNSFGSRVARQLRRRAAQHISRKAAVCALVKPIVSFTFDDFPRSSLAVGGSILEDAGYRGTFYAAMSLSGSDTESGEMFRPEDLVKLIAAGHELGCHTFRHLRCDRVPATSVRDDCAENRRAIEAIVPGYQIQSFALPFGDVSLQSKTQLAQIYETCRGTEAGANNRMPDLAFLKANPLYSHRPIDRVMRDLEGGIQTPSWTIFYTHDVDLAPSPFGCTPEYFARAVAHVKDCGVAVLTMAQAAKLLKG